MADRLYTVPPARFVAARDEAVSRARAAGDRATAAALAKLRRPTVAAWLVNLLALRRPDLVAELDALAAGLREAQRGLRGERLRELAAQRRAVVSALVATARALAVEEDPTLARATLPLAEVEATLHAALADQGVAERVRGGRLLKPVAYAGFGEPPRPRLRLVPGLGDAGVERSTAADEAALRDELARAREAAGTAAADLERALAAQRAAEEELAALDARLAELSERRDALADRLGRLRAQSLAARRAAAAARRRVGELAAALDDARP